MKRSHLLAITLLSFFSFSCDKKETAEPVAEEFVGLSDYITEEQNAVATVIRSVDSNRRNLLIEESFESDFSKSLRNSKYHQFKYFADGNRVFYDPSKYYAFNPGKKYVRDGNWAARFEMRKSDPNIVRAEIQNNNLGNERDRWYGLSVFLPEEYWQRSVNWDIITQFWAQPDPGEPNRNPPIALVVSNGRLMLNVYYASRSINSNTTRDGEKSWDLGPVEKNKWLDFVFHINYSHKSDGVLELWKNGVKVISYKGPNSYNDKFVPYFKFGLYKRQWSDVSVRALYVDEVRVGNGAASYNDVAPGKNSRR